MIALIQRSLTLGLLLLAVALGIWAAVSDRPGLPVALLLLIVLGHAAVLGLEILLMHLANARDPAPRATVRQLLRAWFAESAHAPLVFCWRQPFRSRKVPDRLVPGATLAGNAPATADANRPSRASGGFHPTAGTGAEHGLDATGPVSAGACADHDTTATTASLRRGVLLIPGFVCNRGIWNRWLLRLCAQGVPFVAVDLEPVFGSIDDYVEPIERAVQQLQQATGRPPIAVAHSMGGLALRRWWCVAGNEQRIAHALTLGSPHHGTWIARFAMSPNARQMRLRSAWLQALQRLEDPATRTRLTCFYSNTDNIVFPASSAALPGADNRLLPGVPHVAMADDPRPWAELQRRLAQG